MVATKGAAVALAVLAIFACSPAAGSTAQPSSTPSPPELDSLCTPPAGLSFQTIWLTTSDGIRLYAITAGDGGVTVVLAHQAQSSLCGWLSYIPRLNAAGFRVLAFNFRGTTPSEQSPSRPLALGLDLAAAAAQARRDGAAHLFLVGASMGGAAVVQNSAGIQVDGRISLSGTRLWAGYGVNDPAAVAGLTAPYLYVGSRNDRNAPLDEAQQVFQAVGSKDKTIVLYDGSTHGWDLVEWPPYGDRNVALINDWIRHHA